MHKPSIHESVMKSLRWAGYETLYLTRDMKWLPETIQLRDEDTVEELLTALKSGQADAGCLTLDDESRRYTITISERVLRISAE